MPLKPLAAAPTAPSTKAAKSKVPIVIVGGGDLVTRFATAKKSEKAAKAAIDELKPEMDTLALSYYMRMRSQGGTSTSLKLEDEKGSVLRFDFKDQYSAVDPAQAEQLFEVELGKDVNAYAQSQMKVTFDNAVFFDKKGDFSAETYKRYHDAIAAVSASLGLPNPIKSVEMVAPKPGFHEQRFVDFDREQNHRITEVVKNTVAYSVINVADGVGQPTSQVVGNDEEV